MRKMITYCDYCGKKIDAVYGLVPLRLLDRDRDIWEMDKETSIPDMCLDCMVNIRSAISPEALSKKTGPVEDPEEEAVQEAVSEEPEEQQEPPKKKQMQTRKVDHGRIVALYTANPPRSIGWIADDCKCSQQTVINHLVKEGIYKPRKEREEIKVPY